MIIPTLDLKREYSFLKDDIQEQLKECFFNQQWVLGEKVNRFEEEAAEYLGAKSAIGVASGTDALILSLTSLALKIKGKLLFDRKDEIITTPFTFIATAEAIVRCGAMPVFVDIDPDTFNIDPSAIEKAVTKNTVGIMPVHLYGLGCDMSRICGIAKDHDLFIVEDSAQAFGADYENKKLGTFGDFGAYSFFPSKNLGGIGDGGLVATNNLKSAQLVKILRNHGQKSNYNADYLGFNSRLDSIQAAVLLAKLKYIDKFNGLRRKTAERYNQAFADIKGVYIPDAKIKKSSELIQKPSDRQRSICSAPLGHIYHQYTIKVSSGRDGLLNYLNSKGIGARIYYPVLLNKMKAFKEAKVKGILSNSEDAESKVLSLPLHAFLVDKEITYIIESVRSFFKV